MTYDNPHGGTWVYDAANPLNNDAQAQSWSKPLNQNWTWGVDKIYGVNLGGWLNTEPFIVPGLYEVYANGSNGQLAIDEYTLSQNMGDNLTAAMTEHYETFVTERDFAEIASAGLNWIRLPIAHWAIETWPGEPYLERTSWTYILKAIKWARKYGIRLQLDLHTVPGSQNGWNHSGKIGSINWMNGASGLVNAQRALDYIRTLAQFISQPEYAPVIPMFGFINEPNANGLGQRAVGSFYHEVHNMVREITGFGEGNGPFLSFHDGFIGIGQWYDFLPGADRLAVDQHPYMVSVSRYLVALWLMADLWRPTNRNSCRDLSTTLSNVGYPNQPNLAAIRSQLCRRMVCRPQRLWTMDQQCWRWFSIRRYTRRLHRSSYWFMRLLERLDPMGPIHQGQHATPCHGQHGLIPKLLLLDLEDRKFDWTDYRS